MRNYGSNIYSTRQSPDSIIKLEYHQFKNKLDTAFDQAFMHKEDRLKSVKQRNTIKQKYESTQTPLRLPALNNGSKTLSKVYSKNKIKTFSNTFNKKNY